MSILSNLQFRYEEKPLMHRVSAVSKEQTIGALEWNKEDGNVKAIMVNPDYRRKGVATSLWDKAHEISNNKKIAKPVHATNATEEGAAWIRGYKGKNK